MTKKRQGQREIGWSNADVPEELRKEIDKLWKEVWSGADGARSKHAFWLVVMNKILQDRLAGVPDAEIASFLRDAVQSIHEKRFIVLREPTELDRNTLSIRQRQ
jgi:hypothetical protein